MLNLAGLSVDSTEFSVLISIGFCSACGQHNMPEKLLNAPNVTACFRWGMGASWWTDYLLGSTSYEHDCLSDGTLYE